MGIGTMFLYLIMLASIFAAFGSFFMLHQTREAIEALIIGFLFSPYGLPMIGVTVIAFIEVINDRIRAV